MAVTVKRISFDELSDNLASVFAYVIHEGGSVVIETDEGKLVSLAPIESVPSPRKTEVDWEAFRAAAGSWHDVDTDRFLEEIYASRRSSRPPVEL